MRSIVSICTHRWLTSRYTPVSRSPISKPWHCNNVLNWHSKRNCKKTQVIPILSTIIQHYLLFITSSICSHSFCHCNPFVHQIIYARAHTNDSKKQHTKKSSIDDNEDDECDVQSARCDYLSQGYEES